MPTRSLFAPALLLSWCLALLAARVYWSGTLTYAFLAWNLLLACIPLLAARMLRHSPGWALVWLAFFPNAPYITTDLMHLRPRLYTPFWFDVALLFSCAVTGILLGYLSLAEVQREVRARAGALVSWLTVPAALFASAFGIYLGRFRRWNSWQVLTDPLPLLADVAARLLHPLSHMRAWGVTAIYGTALLVGYVVWQRTNSCDGHPRHGGPRDLSMRESSEVGHAALRHHEHPRGDGPERLERAGASLRARVR